MNQAKTARVKATLIARPVTSAPRSVAQPSTAASHGNRPIQPSANHGQSTRAYSAKASALAIAAPSVRTARCTGSGGLGLEHRAGRRILDRRDVRVGHLE